MFAKLPLEQSFPEHTGLGDCKIFVKLLDGVGVFHGAITTKQLATSKFSMP